jgi:hypothetical protein
VERISGRADRDDLPAEANNRSTLDDSKFAQIFTPPWAMSTSPQRNQLSDVYEKDRRHRPAFFR